MNAPSQLSKAACSGRGLRGAGPGPRPRQQDRPSWRPRGPAPPTPSNPPPSGSSDPSRTPGLPSLGGGFMLPRHSHRRTGVRTWGMHMLSPALTATIKSPHPLSPPSANSCFSFFGPGLCPCPPVPCPVSPKLQEYASRGMLPSLPPVIPSLGRTPAHDLHRAPPPPPGGVAPPPRAAPCGRC